MTGRRVLIVGAGVMGHRHADAVRTAGDHIACIVDSDPARASALDSAAAAYSSVSEALAGESDLDSAIIATPSASHLSLSSQLVAAGLDVLVEKPHRVPGQDVAPLAQALETGGRLFVGMSTRQWPGVRFIAQAVSDGELGDLLTYSDRMQYRLEANSLPAWYFDSSISGGGVLVTNGVHALDRARAIAGSPLEFVAAHLRRLSLDHDGEDHASVVAKTQSGSAVTVEMSWVPYSPVAPGLVVTGSRGCARLSMDGSWSLSTTTKERTGEAIDIDREPFVRQWRSFDDNELGFGLADLEPTLELIEQIYVEVPLV